MAGRRAAADDTAALSIASTVTVTAVNDEPSLTATAANPTFTENGPAVTLYTGTVIDVVEATDRVQAPDVDGVGAAKRVRRDPGGGRHERDVDRRHQRDDGGERDRLQRGGDRRDGDGDAEQDRRHGGDGGPDVGGRSEVPEHQRGPVGVEPDGDADVDPGQWRDGGRRR